MYLRANILLFFIGIFALVSLRSNAQENKPASSSETQKKTEIGLNGQIEDDARLIYMYQYSWGIMLHNHGFALNFRRGRSFGDRKKGLFDIELSTMRHPKEYRSQNNSISNSGSYVYGKMNSVMLMRTGYGIKSTLFTKEILPAVEISWFGSLGASTALAKPIYLEVIKKVNGTREIEKYDPEKHTQDNISGKAPWLMGLSELKVIPGIYGRFGLQFDYSGEDDGIKFIETGVILDFHPSPLPIMAYNSSNPFTTSLYISLNFGKKWNY